MRTFSEYLKKAGYRLAYAGKWHVSNVETPADLGWQELTEYQRNVLSRSNDDWDRVAKQTHPPDHLRQCGEIFRPGWGSTYATGEKLAGPDSYTKTSCYKSSVLPGIRAIPELAKQDQPWMLCISTDIGPTTPVPVDIAALYEPPADWPDAWYSQTKGNEVYYTQRIVQTDRWKYVCNWFDSDELYDLEADPHEMTNLVFPSGIPSSPDGLHPKTTSQSFTPWPPLPPHLDSVRRELLGKMWRFAHGENDIIFNSYPPVALAPYGPLVGLRGKLDPNRKVIL